MEISCCSPKSKLLCLSAVLVALVIVATASFVLGRVSVKPLPIAQISPTPTAPISTPTPNPTANWKTYTNDVYYFTFKYPVEFTAQEMINGVVVINLMNNETRDFPNFNLTIEKTNKTVEEWIASKNFCPANGTPPCSAFKPGPIIKSIQFEELERHYDGIDTVFANNGYVFDFSFGAKIPNQSISQEMRNVYNQILSTFQFLD